MFSGVIEAIGLVQNISTSVNQAHLELTCPKNSLLTLEPAGATSPPDWQSPPCKIGDSLAVQGVCLTITQLKRAQAGNLMLQFELGSETLRRTNLSELAPGDRVNLEQSLCLNQRLHGHIVQGHVDQLGTLSQCEREGDSLIITVEVATSLLIYLAQQGSIAVDGVSLTIASLQESDTPSFSFMLTPYTQQNTTLAEKPIGAKLNLEVDILAKHVQRLLSYNTQHPA